MIGDDGKEYEIEEELTDIGFPDDLNSLKKLLIQNCNKRKIKEASQSPEDEKLNF